MTFLLALSSSAMTVLESVSNDPVLSVRATSLLRYYTLPPFSSNFPYSSAYSCPGDHTAVDYYEKCPPTKCQRFVYRQGHCNEHGRRLPLLLCPGDSFQTQGQRRIRLRNIPPHGVSEAQKAGIIRCITHCLNIRIHRRKLYSAPTYIESHQTHEMECFVA